MTNFYFSYKTFIFYCAFLIPIIICGIHFFTFRSKRQHFKSALRTVVRFNLKERIFHFIRSLSFILVVVSGLFFVSNQESIAASILHGINGWVFVLISFATIYIWIKDAIFYDYDKQWLRHMGNYFNKEHTPLPSGKFNAGQKIFFWLTSLLSIFFMITGILLIRAQGEQYYWFEIVLTFHGIAAALTVSLIIGHIYLSLMANPGTFHVLFDGKVSKEWALYHHPNWKTDVKKNKHR
ncbi:formate dehydrogenase subunit gamma [Desulfolucanica intricata]|uniref:formate dehydrogenase subunit gamma n=1 Tax=Desulfolucanica intricata TaxID=1285191 RepID=UPI00082AF8C3|nr:formate dehydrogenase subunit gamma [Desulfolucanica intricata]